MSGSRSKKQEVTCALCVEAGNEKTAFVGTKAQLRRHVQTAHKGKPIGGK